MFVSWTVTSLDGSRSGRSGVASASSTRPAHDASQVVRHVLLQSRYACFGFWPRSPGRHAITELLLREHSRRARQAGWLAGRQQLTTAQDLGSWTMTWRTSSLDHQGTEMTRRTFGIPSGCWIPKIVLVCTYSIGGREVVHYDFIPSAPPCPETQAGLRATTALSQRSAWFAISNFRILSFQNPDYVKFGIELAANPWPPLLASTASGW